MTTKIDLTRDEPVSRLRAALAALHPSARYVRVEAIDLEAALAAPPVEVEGIAECERCHGGEFVDDGCGVIPCPSCSVSASDYRDALRSTAPALDVAVRNFLAAWPNIVNHPRLDNVEVAALRAALEGAQGGD